jgi:perosamine synthetase
LHIHKKIKFWQPELGTEEQKYIKRVFDSNYPNEGELTSLFEQRICKLLGTKHAIAVTSGTTAIFLSLKALGIQHGDEVIVPDITFIATANAVQMCGATPVLVDIDQNAMMSPNALVDAISPKTKAIIPVHVSGRAADMDSIIKISNSNGIPIVEDAAEAFMSKYGGKCLGTFGDVGCFSLSPNKTITTGQGGIIVTDDDDMNLRLRKLKDHGRATRGTGGNDLHNIIGYNFKFTDIQAAVGLGQLVYLEDRIINMENIHRMYEEKLAELDDIFLFTLKKGEIPQWTDCTVAHRDELVRYLASIDIECRKFWLPIHTQKPYMLPDDNFINSIRLSKKAMWLPSAFSLYSSDIDKVCENIRKFFNEN